MRAGIRPLLSVLILSALTATLLAVPSEPAQADTKSSPWTYHGRAQGTCTWGRAALRHGSDNRGVARSRVRTYMVEPSWTPGCQLLSGNRFRWVHQHAAKVRVRKYNASRGTWYDCYETSWSYRNNAASSVLDSNIRTRCGTGWYGVIASSYSKTTSTGSWIGGTTYSGTHWLPS